MFLCFESAVREDQCFDFASSVIEHLWPSITPKPAYLKYADKNYKPLAEVKTKKLYWTSQTGFVRPPGARRILSAISYNPDVPPSDIFLGICNIFL